MGRTGSRIPSTGLSWDDIKSKLETETDYKIKPYDDDLNLVIDLAALPTIPRSKLEYPTEDVSFAYLAAIGKIQLVSNTEYQYRGGIFTSDSFTDKATKNLSHGDYSFIFGRWTSTGDWYRVYQSSGVSTQDFKLDKRTGGTYTEIASESVDFGSNDGFINAISCSGSTLKAFREDLTTPKIDVTDTDHASGVFGVGNDEKNRPWTPLTAELLAPLTQLPSAKAIVEAEITGSGSDKDPFRPNLAQLLDKHPEFGDIDKLSVTWGAFDHKPTHPSMLITIKGDNPYQPGAVLKQIEYAKNKNLKVLKSPGDYAEAVEQYKQLRRDFPEWIAGKENYAYQCLGHEDIEPLAVADFYYGELIEHKTHYNQLRQVPDWEMRRTLRMWYERLKRVTVLSEEKKKHLKKLEEVLKLGW